MGVLAFLSIKKRVGPQGVGAEGGSIPWEQFQSVFSGIV